jgi:hypothetical protein
MAIAATGIGAAVAARTRGARHPRLVILDGVVLADLPDGTSKIAEFWNLVAPQRLTDVVDIGANPIDSEPPYTSMLAAGLCRVTGFEPQHAPLLELQRNQGPHECYGAELAVFRGGKAKLAETVAIQTEVSFMTLYQDQPTLGDIDSELRGRGFLPHCFAAIKLWPIAACVDPRQPLNQLLEADMVYVRDFTQAESMSDEQLKHLALISHYCYRSFDLALRCAMLLEQRHAVEAGTQQRYRDVLATG